MILASIIMQTYQVSGKKKSKTVALERVFADEYL